MSEQDFDAGHVFFRAGDPADCAYQLHAGDVELLAESGDSAKRVRLFTPGDVFGEMALIEERPRAFTARAVTSGRAGPMTRDEFEHHLTHDPAQARFYLRSLFERLRALTVASAGGVDSLTATPTESDAASTAGSPLEFPVGPGTSSEWVVAVHPLTHKAAETLPEEGLLVSRFPLRIGRATGAREPEALDLNDLWLLDQAPYQVSRNHCEIAVSREGPLVRDRGSHLGCIVNDQPIGGRADMGYSPLAPGDNVVVVGSRRSKYQFRVRVSPAVAE